MKESSTQLNFLKYTNLYFGISVVLLSTGIISLLLFGLKPGIDFTGGALLEVQIEDDQPVLAETVESQVADLVEVSSVQQTSESYILRSKEISNEVKESLLERLSENYDQVQEVRFETVGPLLGRELLQKTLVAVVVGSLAIMAYIAYQFRELKYGICAILAMFHDTFIVIGSFSLLGHFLNVEVDTLFMTALLTTLSFSIHDTIVVYDRIRESLHRSGMSDFQAIVNKAIAETLSRSINNSMTIIFMLSALVLLGGESIRWFVFALLIGTITGTYSSTFTAAPLLVLWEKLKRK